MTARYLVLLALGAAGAWGQVSGNGSLTGTYHFRHVLLISGGETRSADGTLTFDGTGGFTYNGQQLVGAAAPAVFSGSGAYTVKPGGVTTLSNPLLAGKQINARLGQGALIGASTEAGPNVFDLFIAIPASTQLLTSAILTGSYYVSSLEIPGGDLAYIRETQSKLTANGAGGIAEMAVTGQAYNLGDLLTMQTVTPMTYGVGPDGTGSLNFPLGVGQSVTSQLISGTKKIRVAADGSYFIGGSLSAGLHGMVVGVKAFSGGATNASWTGAFYNAGLRFDADILRLASVTGGLNVSPAGAAFGRRTRQPDGVFDANVLTTFTLAGDGSGPFTSTTGTVSVAAGGNQFSTSGVGVVDTLTYELSFGVRMIPQSGPGVFLNPQGVLNAANYAVGYPIAPGAFAALFGTGMSTQSKVADALPFPTLLGGVRVTVNGVDAPLYVVSPELISLIVPYEVTGPTATLVVFADGVASNVVEVAAAASAPGVFSLTANGLGDGAVRRADTSIVTAANPAKLGESVAIYLTGMGAVSPKLVNGVPAPLAEPLARVTGLYAVTIGGLACDVDFAGLTPGLAGLYQLNVKIPLGLAPGLYPLAVQTMEGFTDMVSVWVGAP